MAFERGDARSAGNGDEASARMMSLTQRTLQWGYRLAHDQLALSTSGPLLQVSWEDYVAAGQSALDGGGLLTHKNIHATCAAVAYVMPWAVNGVLVQAGHKLTLA